MTAWSNNPLTPGAPVRVIHITELRAAVDALRQAAHPPIPTGGWTDNPLSSTIGIQAVHFTELAAAIAQLWSQQGMGPLPPWSAPEGAPTPGNPIRASAVNDLRNWVNQYDPPSLIGAMWTSANPSYQPWDWNAKDGWAVELIYYDDPGGFDLPTIEGRATTAMDNGRQLLLRVDFSTSASIPTTETDCTTFFNFLAQLATDANFVGYTPSSGTGKFVGLIIGNEPNNQNISAAQFARVLNGGTDQEPRSAISTIKAANGAANVLVGAVAPYGGMDADDPSYDWTINVPWLNYFNEVYSVMASNQGNAVSTSAPPDGFAIHAYGRTGSMGTDNNGPQEPMRNVSYDNTQAQWGFRVYEDWQSIVQQDGGAFVNTPIYITETNTDQGSGAQCNTSYPAVSSPGWYVNALAEIFGQPGQAQWTGQLQCLCWFVDENYGGVWTNDSLQEGLAGTAGNMSYAASDFQYALSSTPY